VKYDFFINCCFVFRREKPALPVALVHVNREISFTFHVSLFTTNKGTTHEEPPTTIDYRL